MSARVDAPPGRQPMIAGWIGAILILALALRVFPAVNLEAGRSGMGSCDDPFEVQVQSILRTGNLLDLEQFYYPPIPAILTAPPTALVRAAGAPLGSACRAVSILFSLAMVAVMYGVGRFWGHRHGLLAMAYSAVTMIAAVGSNTPQIVSALFVALAMYYVLRAVRDDMTSSLVLAGAALGLGVASKYTPLFFAGMLLVPMLLGVGRPSGGTPSAPSSDPETSTGWARAWVVGLLGAGTLCAVAVLVGVLGRAAVYSLLRRLYDSRPHENPFEYHLVWIARLYNLGLGVVAVAAMTLVAGVLVPWALGASPWAWTVAFSRRHRRWLVPVVAMIATAGVGIGLPALYNVPNYARDFVYVARTRNSGDNGIFPGHMLAPSYALAYIPENMGWPLFLAALTGLVYVVYRRDRRALLLLAAALPAYVMLESQTTKINRYALELVPLGCLLAAIWTGDLSRRPGARGRLVSLAATGVIVYSTVYALAWGEFASPRNSPQAAAARWLEQEVPSGVSLGARSDLLVTGSPQLLPKEATMARYRVVDYREQPEVILLPNLAHDVVVLYLEGRRKGYVYTARDWDSSNPSEDDLEQLSRVVRQEGYVLVKNFRKTPRIFGLDMGSDSLAGRTWFAEHSSAIGLRIYRRAGAQGS